MTTTTATRTYKIDKAHSEATFQVRYLLTKVRGRFSDFDGTIQFDEANPEKCSVDVTIQSASIDTNEADRDKHLRSADFFNVDEFNSITFKSKRITKRSADVYDMVGDLTMHGVTKSVTIPLQTQLNGSQIEVVGSLTFPMSDFGMDPPTIAGIVDVESDATLEFQLFLAQ